MSNKDKNRKTVVEMSELEKNIAAFKKNSKLFKNNKSKVVNLAKIEKNEGTKKNSKRAQEKFVTSELFSSEEELLVSDTYVLEDTNRIQVFNLTEEGKNLMFPKPINFRSKEETFSPEGLTVLSVSEPVLVGDTEELLSDFEGSDDFDDSEFVDEDEELVSDEELLLDFGLEKVTLEESKLEPETEMEEPELDFEEQFLEDSSGLDSNLGSTEQELNSEEKKEEERLSEIQKQGFVEFRGIIYKPVEKKSESDSEGKESVVEFDSTYLSDFDIDEYDRLYAGDTVEVKDRISLEEFYAKLNSKEILGNDEDQEKYKSFGKLRAYESLYIDEFEKIPKVQSLDKALFDENNATFEDQKEFLKQLDDDDFYLRNRFYFRRQRPSVLKFKRIDSYSLRVRVKKLIRKRIWHKRQVKLDRAFRMVYNKPHLRKKAHLDDRWDFVLRKGYINTYDLRHAMFTMLFSRSVAEANQSISYRRFSLNGIFPKHETYLSNGDLVRVLYHFNQEERVLFTDIEDNEEATKSRSIFYPFIEVDDYCEQMCVVKSVENLSKSDTFLMNAATTRFADINFLRR